MSKLRLRVHSIFHTISGETGGTEGIVQGSLCTVLRLSGCKLACPYCDAKEAASGKVFEELKIKEVHKRLCNELQQVNGEYAILVTGGEPLLQQAGLLALYKEFDGEAFFQIETNGSILPGKALMEYNHYYCGNGRFFVVDIKSPGIYDKNEEIQTPAFNEKWLKYEYREHVLAFKVVVPKRASTFTLEVWLQAMLLDSMPEDVRDGIPIAIGAEDNDPETLKAITQFVLRHPEWGGLSVHYQLHKLCGAQ